MCQISLGAPTSTIPSAASNASQFPPPNPTKFLLDLSHRLRNILDEGKILYNVQYLEPVPERIKEITYTEENI